MRTVREIVEEVKMNNNITHHKLLGNVEVLNSDWIRVYKGGNCIIYESIYTGDWCEEIPEEVLNTKVNFFNTWMIGGELSLECVILTDKFKQEYKHNEEMLTHMI